MQFRVYRGYGLLLHLLSEKGNMYSTMRIFRHVRIHRRVQALQKRGMTMANIPKAAMRATNNAMRGYIPHNGIVSAGAKIVAKNQSGSRSAGKRKHRTRLTEISRGSGKAIISDGVTVNQAIKKLHDYEDTGLSPQAVRNLIEREKNLTEKILKMQDW